MPMSFRRALLLGPSIVVLLAGCGSRPPERLRLATGLAHSLAEETKMLQSDGATERVGS